jgi:hypothetical protein
MVLSAIVFDSSESGGDGKGGALSVQTARVVQAGPLSAQTKSQT